jgi:hypothetical protein
MAPVHERRQPKEHRDRDKSDRPRMIHGGGRRPPIDTVLEQFRDFSQLVPEHVTGVRATDDGWSFLVDVVEVERIPATTSVLATYRLDVDGDGNLVGYERLRRFVRGATDSS